MTSRNLAIFGGDPAFRKIRSTSNLVQPDPSRFFHYARQSYDSGWLTNKGPMVRLLERRLAELHDTEYCVATCNGLWAILLCIHCLALEGRREIIMPSLTYRRMADIAAWLRLVPRFCDVDRENFGLSVAATREAINDATALILAAHPIVHLCDLDGLERLSAASGVPLLIDSVEAAYATYDGRAVGCFGVAECFSMHASKFLNAFEAGYITTNDGTLAGRLQRMRAFGFHGPDQVVEYGLNAKLNEFHAAMALAALDDLDDQVERNRARFLLYRDLLADVSGISLVEYDMIERRTFKNILVELTDEWPLSREQTLQILHAENMLARPYYYPPLHDKAADYPTITGDMRVSDRLKHRYLLLPSGEFLDHEDIHRVVDLLAHLSGAGRAIGERLDAASP